MRFRYRSIGSLASWMLCIATVWCVVLPWLSGRPSVKERLQFLDDRGIDASAMYYTELEAMEPILDRIEGQAMSRADR